MTLMRIDISQSAAHKGNLLQGRKSSINSNNNINQQNANQNKRNSISPPLSKNICNNQQESVNKQLNIKLERSISEPASERKIVQATNSSRYKTELCRPFEENGTCKYGDKCQFAHGEKELRSMARHPKYKTELCRTFHSTGLCPYGPRCHFIHNSEQAKKSLLTNLACNSAPVPPVGRPEALNSVGSTVEISPPSSHSGSPTSTKNFDDLYIQAPLSPPLNDVLYNQDNNMPMASYLQKSLLAFIQDPSRDCSSEFIDTHNGYNNKMMMENDNYMSQGPVLELFPTAPLTPATPNDITFNYFQFFDTFAAKG